MFLKHRNQQQLCIFLVALTIGTGLGFYAARCFLPTKPIDVSPAVNISPPDQTNLSASTTPSPRSLVSNSTNSGLQSAPLAVRAFAIEREFVSALKSCLGSKCIDERPKGSAKDRVLVTALPGSGGDILFQLLSHLASTEKSSPVEVVFSSRALPYGYGRNFGFNRVIKIVGRPLWNIFAMLDEFDSNGRSHEKEEGEGTSLLPSFSAQDSAAAGVQFLRWHCRQKVGHTKSLLVFAEDLLLKRPLPELERAASFAGLKPDRPRLLRALAQAGIHSGGEAGGGGVVRGGSKKAAHGLSPGPVVATAPWPAVPNEQAAQIARVPTRSALSSSGSSRRGLDLGTSPEALAGSWPWPHRLGSGAEGGAEGAAAAAAIESAVRAMEAELERSNTLQKWPCGSLKGQYAAGPRHPLATGLLPNCSLPFVDCFVSHDSANGEHV